MDPDQLASEKPADQDLHSFQKRIYIQLYYIPINDTFFEMSVFWPPDTECHQGTEVF